MDHSISQFEQLIDRTRAWFRVLDSREEVIEALIDEGDWHPETIMMAVISVEMLDSDYDPEDPWDHEDLEYEDEVEGDIDE